MTTTAPALSDETDRARSLLDRFLHDTGVVSPAPPRRYLWTDAYAVQVCLALHQRMPAEGYLEVALRLVDQVHEILGRHRPDDARSGWISGLGEDEGADHPTAGGLRIGKPLPERAPGAPYDPRLEWDRDGQYFHYLTRWIDALDAVGAVVPEGPCSRWAIELARTAYARFRVPEDSGRSRGLYWKMSIALDRPLVPSTGQHDAVDGLATFAGLERDDAAGERHENPLAREIRGLVTLCTGGSWATNDALGIGGLLTATCRLARVRAGGGSARALIPSTILHRATDDAVRSLRGLDTDAFGLVAPDHRLAFRELGLAIGLGEVERLNRRSAGETPSIVDPRRVDAVVRALGEWTGLRHTIVGFWQRPAHRAVRSWTDHDDINTVMLAAAMVSGPG